MTTQNFSYVVAYRDTSEETDAQIWADGDFEAYDFYSTKENAQSIAKILREELKSAGRKDVKIFVHRATTQWCEAFLA